MDSISEIVNIVFSTLRIVSQVMTSLPAFVFFILCRVVSMYYKHLSTLITENQVNEDHMIRLNRFLPIFAGLRDITELIRHQFCSILLVTVPFIYMSLITNVYLIVVKIKVSDVQMSSAWWSGFVAIENMLRISIICFSVDNIYDKVGIFIP